MQPSQLAEDFFRHESGKLVSLLVRMMGPEHLPLAEDVVQETVVRALKAWPYYGVPENPAAWMTLTAKNLALDVLRREKLAKRKQIDMFGSNYKWSAQILEADAAEFDRDIDDAVLRMMFVCSHPLVPRDAQPLLALKTLCGFSIEEIASAFLTSDTAIQKRLTRARERLREAEVPSEFVLGDDFDERLDGVLKTIYLLFNEGYKATSGESLVREDLCAEAIRLALLIARHPSGNLPQVHALLALMYFSYARLATRTSEDGDLMLLKDQDRSKWDRGTIEKGLWHLGQSSRGTVCSLHVQAAIAGVHCSAPEYAVTDWAQILGLYDVLMSIEPTPVVALNRAVALAEVEGPRAALSVLDDLGSLDRYHLYFAARADFEMRLGMDREAAEDLAKAIELTASPAEKALLSKRRESLSGHRQV